MLENTLRFRGETAHGSFKMRLLILSHVITEAFKFRKIHKQQKFTRFIDFY